MRKGDRDALEDVLDECIAAGMPELDADIHRARRALDEQEELDERQRRGQRECWLNISLLIIFCFAKISAIQISNNSITFFL